jgi:hypothetical protein
VGSTDIAGGNKPLDPGDEALLDVVSVSGLNLREVGEMSRAEFNRCLAYLRHKHEKPQRMDYLFAGLAVEIRRLYNALTTPAGRQPPSTPSLNDMLVRFGVVNVKPVVSTARDRARPISELPAAQRTEIAMATLAMMWTIAERKQKRGKPNDRNRKNRRDGAGGHLPVQRGDEDSPGHNGTDRIEDAIAKSGHAGGD